MADANLIGGIIGGFLIGIAAALLLWANGRIAGISGILGGVILPAPAVERPWRSAFLLGLIGGAASYAMITGKLPIELETNVLGLIAAGLLVGVGTRLGSGCTSGHGVCGLARRSPRSLTATLTFIISGVITVYLFRHF